MYDTLLPLQDDKLLGPHGEVMQGKQAVPTDDAARQAAAQAGSTAEGNSAKDNLRATVRKTSAKDSPQESQLDDAAEPNLP
jgi:hypothetical protein